VVIIGVVRGLVSRSGALGARVRGACERQAQLSRRMAESATLEAFAARADASWTKQLSEDPEARRYEPNRSSREVRSGHFVRVAPKALGSPELLLYSEEVAADLGLSREAVEDERFVRYFSGEASALNLGGTWATPYALSIMGQEMYSNCPFGTGDGYGDGRAISVGEVVVEGKRYELQLKGGGQTPFCRRADGRAVLRSSLREFLASEAMHFLGVETTRALCLVASRGETVERGWYSGGSGDSVGEDDPRLAHLPTHVRKQLVRELRGRMDVAIRETTAITCRVAPSFMRVGHLDLFARRAAREPDDALRRDELRAIVAHAIFREYPDLWREGLATDPVALRAAAVAMATRARDNLARLAAGWIRVGFCQGNFNADNCLVAGRTMDYGPFGFMDQYDPGFAKWVGSGEHFAFANQPKAAQVNFATLVKSLVPLFSRDDPDGLAELRALVETADDVFRAAVDAAFASKLGFPAPSDRTVALWRRLEPLLRSGRLDYSIAFRELAEFDASRLLDRAAYPGGDDVSTQLAAWIDDWTAALADAGIDRPAAALAMNRANPKYVLREWMLVDAYNAANRGDLSVARDLHALVKSPYDDQPDFHDRYYRRADPDDLTKPGTAFMT